jgi:hypothetical protein
LKRSGLRARPSDTGRAFTSTEWLELMERTLSPDQIAAKKKQRRLEGQANMARNLEQQQEILNKTERLRALRLAQGRGTTDPIKPTKRPPKPKRAEPRQSLPGLHKGVRGWS